MCFFCIFITVGDATVSYTVKVVNTNPATVASTLQSPAAVAAVTVAMAVGGYVVTTEAPVTKVEQASPAPAVSPSSSSSSNKMNTDALIGIIVGSCVGGVLLMIGIILAVQSHHKKRRQASSVVLARQSMINNYSLDGTGTSPEQSFPVSMNPVFLSYNNPMKKDSLASQIENKVPWKDASRVGDDDDESEVRPSEMAIPSEKMSRSSSIMVGHHGRSNSAVIAPELYTFPGTNNNRVGGSGISIMSHPGPPESHPPSRDSIPPVVAMETEKELEHKPPASSAKSAWDFNAKL